MDKVGRKEGEVIKGRGGGKMTGGEGGGGWMRRRKRELKGKGKWMGKELVSYLAVC